MWVRLSLEAQVWLGIPALSLLSWHPKQGCGVRPKTEVSAACCHNSKRNWGVPPHSTIYPLPDSVFEARTATTPQPRAWLQLILASHRIIQTSLCGHLGYLSWISHSLLPQVLWIHCVPRAAGSCEHALSRSLSACDCGFEIISSDRYQLLCWSFPLLWDRTPPSLTRSRRGSR